MRPLPIRPDIRLVVLALVIGVGACNGRAPDRSVCKVGVALSETAARTQRDIAVSAAQGTEDMYRAEMTHADRCIMRWSYRLASATGTPDDLANVVLAGCAVPIRALVAAATRLPDERWTDLETGVEAPAGRILVGRLRSRAAFYVVQGRVGDCQTK